MATRRNPSQRQRAVATLVLVLLHADIADYSFVPVLTMMVGSPYWEHADPVIKAYVADFQGAASCIMSYGCLASSFPDRSTQPARDPQCG
jgi:hypothetical protein